MSKFTAKYAVVSRYSSAKPRYISLHMRLQVLRLNFLHKYN